MPVILQECIEEDAERIAEVTYAAFAEDVFGRIMFPRRPPAGVDTPTIRRYRRLITSEPNVFLMKGVDSNTNQLVGFARWELNLDFKSEDEWDGKAKREWDEGTNVAAADCLIASVVEKDREYMGGIPHLCLGLLDVHPDHQRKGVGKMLVEWGINLADTKGIPCWLQATPQGAGLYPKLGFENVGNMDIDMSKFGGEGIYRYLCMIRPAKDIGTGT